jgi:hypothetical protein
MRLLVSFLAVIPFGSAGAEVSRSAEEYVRLAMLRDQFVTYSCIRTLHRWEEDECIRVRRDQSASGANKITVLSPLSKQGRIIVDDGRQWVSYDPDRELVVVQESPVARISRAEIERRFEILKRNYRLVKQGVDQVAGRTAVRISLEPRAEQLVFARRYWIDVEKFVLLRVEWTDPSGRSRIVSDTLSIQFPESLPVETFQTKFLGKPETIRVEAPKRMSRVEEVSQTVGFDVILPEKMPAGLTFTGADVVYGRRSVLAALRFTDGATNVTIYQGKGDGKDAPWRFPPGGRSLKVGSVYLAVDGDLPVSGRDAIFAALKQAAAQASSGPAEMGGRDDGCPSRQIGIEALADGARLIYEERTLCEPRS